MALFGDTGMSNLEDVLGKQAASASAGVKDQYAQAKKRLVSRLAANGQLMSGVADYPLGDLSAGEGEALSGVQNSLSSALAGIPANDWLQQNNFGRDYNLASMVGRQNKPSTLEEILGAVGKIGPSAAMFAALA